MSASRPSDDRLSGDLRYIQDIEALEAEEASLWERYERATHPRVSAEIKARHHRVVAKILLTHKHRFSDRSRWEDADLSRLAAEHEAVGPGASVPTDIQRAGVRKAGEW